MTRVVTGVLSLFFILADMAPLEAAGPSRSLFVSAIQKPPVLASRAAVDRLMTFAQEARIRTLFVQVYYRGQSWFASRLADDAPYKECRSALREDPLGWFIQKAHQHNIRVHAWLNLLSLGNNKDAPFIKRYGADILTRDLKEKTRLDDFKIDKQFFLEPGDPRVGDDLSKIIKELLIAYPDLDGVLFDYIRYPDVHPFYGYTKVNMDNFKKETAANSIDEHSLAWAKWRYSRVTGLLEHLVNIVRGLRPQMQISATGCMPLARALYEAYQDWPLWLSRGLVDFVTVMDYVDEAGVFNKRMRVVKEKIKDFSKLNIAVGAYKLVRDPEIFKQEFLDCENMGTRCAIFHYGSILENPRLVTFLTLPETKELKVG